MAGDDERSGTNVFALQLFLFWQLDGGWYLRNSAIWTFDPEADTYNVPVGLGVGKAISMGSVVFNLFAEPQFTVLHNGVGQPATQIFIGFNTQFISN